LSLQLLAKALGALGFVALGLVAPGLTVQRLTSRRIDLALVVPAGAAFTAGVYWLSLLAHLPWLYPIGIGLAVAALLVPRGAWSLAPAPPLRGLWAPALAWLGFLALTQYPWNRYGPEGEFVLDPLVPFDTAFHVGLTRELTVGYPPQVPGVSGFPLGYHLGSDLVRAAALRWAGVDPYDAISRVDPTLWGLALMLLLRSVVARLGGGTLAIALAPWTLLATDFSFLLALRAAPVHWWTDLLRGNLLLSLALANPVVPALALALAVLVALSRHEETEGRGWLALAMGLAVAVPFFKVFLGAHLLLGLAAAAVLRRDGRMRQALVVVGLPVALATAALALGQGGATVAVAWAPFDLMRTTRETIGAAPLGGLRFAAWGLFWLVASLGLRLVGLPRACAALARGSVLAVALAAMALAAWPLGLLFRVSALRALPDQKLVNDAAYLVEQGGPLLWIFATLALAEIASDTRRRRALVLLVAAAVSLPSTVQFVVEKSRWPNEAIPAPMVRAAQAVARVSRPGDVVLQRPGGRFPPAPVVLVGRRVPYERFTPWLTQFAAPEALEARHETVYRFFRSRDREEALAIAHGLDAHYLCLYGSDRVRFEPAGALEPVYEEPEAHVFRIR
jgi:hypothetical protein